MAEDILPLPPGADGNRIDMNTMGRISIPGPRVSDVMAYEALPEDTRRLAELVLLGYVATGGGLDGPSLKAAYDAGWDDGVDAAIENINRPAPSKFDFERWLNDVSPTTKRGAA